MSEAPTPTEVKELHNELQTVWSKFRDELESVKGANGEQSAEQAAVITKMSDRMDDLETKLNRSALDAPGGETPDEARADFAAYVRTGNVPEKLKALSRGSDSAGGVFVPEGVAKDLITNLVEVSDVRALADSVTLTEGDSYPYNKRTSEAAAGWSSEQGTRTESTNPAFAKGRIPVHEMYVMIDINRQLLDMAGFDVEGEWMNEATEQCAKLEGAAFVTGNGVGRPEGFTHANAGLSNTDSGHATLIQADSLLGLPLDLKSGYLANAKWAMNRATLKAVRQLKDGNGQYLWSAGFGNTLTQGAPATIDGYAYEVLQDMPDVGAGTFPIAFGDWSGYKIVDHTKVHQIRDEVTQAATGNVRFWVTRYVGGQVVKAEALRLYEITA